MGKKPEMVRFFVSYSRIFQHMNAHFLAQKWHSFGTVVFGRKQGRGHPRCCAILDPLLGTGERSSGELTARACPSPKYQKLRKETAKKAQERR